MTLRRAPLMLCAVSLAVLTACSSGSNSAGPSDLVVAPGVNREYINEAMHTLCSVGTVPRIVKAPDIHAADRNSNGYVTVDMSPSAMSRVPRGSKVDLKLESSINAGGPWPSPAASSVVPDVVGQDVNSALTTLTALGFSVDIKVKTPAVGFVVVAESQAGATLKAGAMVTLKAGSAPGNPCPSHS